jgi:hypothetical protein
MSLEGFVQALSNRRFLYLCGLLAVFFALASVMPTDTLIVVLNGVYIGAMFGIAVCFGGMILDAMTGKEEYDDVSQMVTSMFGTWVALSIAFGVSAYLRAADMSSSSLLASAFARYVGILSAVGQITAPTLGERFFAGRDRKVLWASLFVGLGTAVAVTAAQTYEVLAWPL